jgi:hypothetical protein
MEELYLHSHTRLHGVALSYIHRQLYLLNFKSPNLHTMYKSFLDKVIQGNMVEVGNNAKWLPQSTDGSTCRSSTSSNLCSVRY